MRQRVDPFVEYFLIAVLLALAVVTLALVPALSFLCFAALAAGLLGTGAMLHRQARLQLTLTGMLLLVSIYILSCANHAITRVTPHTLDTAFLYVDHGASTAVYRWTQAHGISRLIAATIYNSLPLFGAFTLCISPRRSLCIRAWVIAAVLAPVFYLSFPASGPAYLHDRYAPRNCMPSLHMTWALLCVLYICPSLRWSALLFAALTAYATLGTGEHYWIDLLAAAPYAYAVSAAERMLRHAVCRLRSSAAVVTANEAAALPGQAQ